MTSPVSDAMIEAGVKAMAQWNGSSGVTAVRAIYLAMKAKKEAADQAQPLISDTTDSVIKGSDQSPADEVERVALQAIIDVRRRAAASFEEGFTGARGQAYDRAVLDCHDAVRAALSAIRNTPQAIEATPCSDNGESEK